MMIVPTPFPGLNRLLDGGLHEQAVALLRGPRDSFKTTLALNIVNHFVNEKNLGVLWFETGGHSVRHITSLEYMRPVRPAWDLMRFVDLSLIKPVSLLEVVGETLEKKRGANETPFLVVVNAVSPPPHESGVVTAGALEMSSLGLLAQSFRVAVLVVERTNAAIGAAPDSSPLRWCDCGLSIEKQGGGCDVELVRSRTRTLPDPGSAPKHLRFDPETMLLSERMPGPEIIRVSSSTLNKVSF